MRARWWTRQRCATRSSPTSSRSYGARVSSRASRSARARAPPCTSLPQPRRRRGSRGASSSPPTTWSPSRPPSCATGFSSGRRPSSSGTPPTTRSTPRSPRSRYRDEHMSPSPRAAIALVVDGLAALALPAAVAIGLAILVVAATAVDMVLARRRPRVRRSIAIALARGVPADLTIETTDDNRAVELRQSLPPDFSIEPARAWGRLDARVVANRRGSHRLPPVAARRRGPLGLGTCTFDAEGGGDILVYPNVFAAQRLVIAVRQGRFRDPG